MEFRPFRLAVTRFTPAPTRSTVPYWEPPDLSGSVRVLRSSAGKAYHDNIVLSGGCAIPAIPSLTTTPRTTIQPVQRRQVVFWHTVSTATKYNVQVSSRPSFHRSVTTEP